MKMLKLILLLLLLINLSTQVDLKIIKTSSGTDRPAPCATICAGETGPNPSLRKYHDGIVDFYRVDIDIRECGFIEKPIITVHLEGEVTAFARWTHAVYRANTRGFRVYITSNQNSISTHPSWNMNVMWSAFGYTC